MVSATTELVRGLFRYIDAEHKQRTRIPQQKAALIRQKRQR